MPNIAGMETGAGKVIEKSYYALKGGGFAHYTSHMDIEHDEKSFR